MKGKGKAKLKSPTKHRSKTSAEDGVQSATIIEMFKKQTDKKLRQSQSVECAIVVDADDDHNEVIVIEEYSISPYFKTGISNITKRTAKNSPATTSMTAVSQNLRKRKLSLAKPCQTLNSNSSCPSENLNNKVHSSEQVNDDHNKSYMFVKTTASTKLSKIDKLDITTDAIPNSKTVNYKNKTNSSDDSKLESPTGTCENLDSVFKSSHISAAQSTSGRQLNSPSETDHDISYYPILSPRTQPIEGTSTVNSKSVEKNIDGDCQEISEKLSVDIFNTKEPSKSTDSHSKDVLPIDTDSNASPGEDISAGDSQFKVPYYLNNFESLLCTVMADETNKRLFNEDDLHVITMYQSLSEGAKKLYIRMFTRKFNWIPINKLKYPEIGEDLKLYLQELAAAAFIDCDDQLTDLEEVLKALTAGDIKILAKSYHIPPNISQKGQLVQELLKKSQQSTLTTMFGSGGGGVAKAMLNRAKKYLSGIYKLTQKPRGVFVRTMMLFSLVNTQIDEDNGTSGQRQLFQMLMVNMGKLVYPTYTIDKVHNIFKGRDDLIRFENALQLESDLLHCIERGKWEQAYIVFKSVEKEWNLLTADESITDWNKSLPAFLRCYTATSVIHRMLSASVEILQRRKDYTAAVELLQTLLSETIYNCSHRGYWWERLALNLDAHLKQPLESLEAVRNGLADSYVRVGHRLALYLRAESICQRTKLKLQHRLTEFHHDVVRKTPQVFIEGRVLHQNVSTNGTRFLTEESYVDGNSQDMTVVGVEEYVLSYYRRNGFPSGIHAEGSIVSTLFALFFWDILFMSMPDAFHSPFQGLPLDLHSDMFYGRRADVIEARLAKIKESSVEELQAQAEETWTNQHGVVCTCISWDRMSLDSVKEILGCMGGEILSGLIGRYARCPRHTRSGFPDLTLWNANTGTFKICEVKGPGDRLSNKQILWIDYLLSLGVDAEVCHVKAVAAKKLKPSQQ